MARWKREKKYIFASFVLENSVPMRLTAHLSLFRAHLAPGWPFTRPVEKLGQSENIDARQSVSLLVFAVFMRLSWPADTTDALHRGKLLRQDALQEYLN